MAASQGAPVEASDVAAIVDPRSGRDRARRFFAERGIDAEHAYVQA